MIQLCYKQIFITREQMQAALQGCTKAQQCFVLIFTTDFSYAPIHNVNMLMFRWYVYCAPSLLSLLVSELISTTQSPAEDDGHVFSFPVEKKKENLTPSF